ncbi:hypothetical protein EPN52_07280 [bacterium]|nr:MAG: hypothetical protein EPN52_07280 [bacterium]
MSSFITVPGAQPPLYVVSDDQLSMGASLGNSTVWLTLRGTGYPQALFDVRAAKQVTWSSIVRYASYDYRFLEPAWSRAAGAGRVLTPLAQLGVGEFTIHPAYQEHRFELQGDLQVRERVFVPRYGLRGDPPGYFLEVTLHNASHVRHHLLAVLATKLKPEVDPSQRPERNFRAVWAERNGVLLVSSDENPDWTRAFTASRRPSRFGASLDHARSSDPLLMAPLDGDTSSVGSLVAEIGVEAVLEPGAGDQFAFFVAFEPDGRDAALATIEREGNYVEAFEKTEAFYRSGVELARISTPEPTINHGVAWSKVNMLRVMVDYPGTGPAFTNEPGVSSNVVIRDAAWFIYGCDYLKPEFSRALLRRIAAVQYDSGKIPEYYNGLTGAVEDYGLNVNDDTPLFVLACVHHIHATGDDDFAREIYPRVRAANDYLLAQRDERGLIFCTARGENVWGVCSWRNVIPNYTLSGAVTEINAECYAALRVGARLAERLGERDDAQRFEQAALNLKTAINDHLRDPRTHLYLLAHDVDGVPRTDTTADMLFPVMFRVADDVVAREVMHRLQEEDFWTEAGLRTVPRGSADYHPSNNVGLLGGVWPGVNFWYAFAAAFHDSTGMVRALRSSYAQYTKDPKTNWTVPGQFSEWFDGESLTNRGMRLSPWEPPRYLWAAIEGMCGINLLRSRHYEPMIPSEWSWLAIANLPLCGSCLTWFAARIEGRLQFFSAGEPAPRDARRHYRDDVTTQVRSLNENAEVVALRKRGELLLCVGSSAEYPTTVPIDLSGLLDGIERCGIGIADEDGWAEPQETAARELARVSVRVAPKGFKLVRISWAAATL